MGTMIVFLSHSFGRKNAAPPSNQVSNGRDGHVPPELPVKHGPKPSRHFFSAGRGVPALEQYRQLAAVKPPAMPARASVAHDFSRAPRGPLRHLRSADGAAARLSALAAAGNSAESHCAIRSCAPNNNVNSAASSQTPSQPGHQSTSTSSCSATSIAFPSTGHFMAFILGWSPTHVKTSAGGLI